MSLRTFFSRCPILAAMAVVPLFPGASALADETPFATEVVEYIPGAAPSGYQTPSAALGKTREFTPALPEFDTPAYLVTPFNATYTPDDLVAIGDGGRLVLQLGRPALTGAGHTVSVHAGVGLIDSNWPSGTISGPAIPYTSFRSADVRVSADGVTWHALGDDIVFEMPSNWYAQGVSAPGAQETPGTAQADFTQPFLGELSDFDDTTWPEALAILNGSAGGTWLDLSAVPAPWVQYIELTVSGTDEVMYVDAVVSVPEPGALALVGACVFLLLRRHGAGLLLR